jgi:large subunit ribosomal protein L29|tara:strand:+ start:133 stop:342 length:210 start_codon:yes stop_codon:yes gene_type:complete
MKALELRNFSIEELLEKENDFKSEIFNLKIQMATGKIENPIRLRILRKDVARVKTIIKEKKLENKVEQD